MGKKKKNKSFYKSEIKPFVSKNKVLLYILGGAALGISLAQILKPENTQEFIDDEIDDFIREKPEALENNSISPNKKNSKTGQPHEPFSQEKL